jgi:hypothetical protein
MIRPILASLLAFWITGAGCMLGCTNGIRAPEPESREGRSFPTIASGTACSSSEYHSCCTKAAGRDVISAVGINHEVARSSDTLSAITTCPLAVRAIAVRVKSSDDETIATALLTNSPSATGNSLRQLAATSPPIEFPNRGDTYLRCCVFLI